MHQKDYCHSIDLLDVTSYRDLSPIARTEALAIFFQSTRGKVSYATTSTRPDTSFHNARLSQIPPEKVSETDIKFLNQAITSLKIDRQLFLPELDLASLYIVGYADAAFANNVDLSSQLGFIVLLKDKRNNAGIIHFGSWKCKRVTRSVLGAEIYAFSHCLDYALALSNELRSILGRKIQTILFTDSKCLFNTITKLPTVSEKRLLIEIAAIRETYTTGDLSNFAHVSSRHNLANVFTKAKADNTMLLNLMSSGNILHPVSQWILPQ